MAAAHLPAGFGHLARILEASEAARRRRLGAWLDALNAYLGVFGLAPLALDEAAAREAGNVLEGLRGAELAPIAAGPKVSVLMPAHDAEATVGYAIRSILAQSWRQRSS